MFESTGGDVREEGGRRRGGESVRVRGGKERVKKPRRCRYKEKESVFGPCGCVWAVVCASKGGKHRKVGRKEIIQRKERRKWKTTKIIALRSEAAWKGLCVTMHW